MKNLDDIFTDKVLKRGRLLITNLSILLKMTDIYNSTNEAVNNAAQRFLSELQGIMGGEEELSIRMADESFFIEDVRVRTTVADLDTFGALIKSMTERGIGTLTFRASLSLDSVIDIAYAIRRGHDVAEIQSSVDEKFLGVGGQIFAQKEGGIDMRDTRLIARRAYARAISSFEDLNKAIKSGKPLNIKKTKRAIQSMVDSIIKDETYALKLTTKKDFDNYHLHHSANVAVLSIVVGKKIGLNKYQLSRLGLSALFHDIGKADIPTDILNKRGELTAGEKALMTTHPVEGVKQLLRARGLSEVFLISMFVSYEHHINLDLTGYPQSGKTPNLYSRIIRIADEFESLTSGRVYSRRAIGNKAALSEILKNSGVYYDPALVNAFAGIFSEAA